VYDILYTRIMDAQRRTEKIPYVIAEANGSILETVNRVHYFTPCRLCERLTC